MNDDAHLTLRLSGEDAGNAEAVGNALMGIDALFKEVARAKGIDPDSISLQVGQMGWVCDGCDCSRPDQHDDWIKRDGLDFCPACASEQKEGEQ